MDDKETVGVWLPRLAGALATYLIGVLLTHIGWIALDQDTTTAVQIGVYAVTHRLISKWTNPGDAASAHLARLEKDQTATIKDNAAVEQRRGGE